MNFSCIFSLSTWLPYQSCDKNSEHQQCVQLDSPQYLFYFGGKEFKPGVTLWVGISVLLATILPLVKYIVLKTYNFEINIHAF